MANNKKILIVEDELFFAETVQDTLMRLKYKVAGIVSTGEEAVKKTEEVRPDLVLMDIVLKGEMDGVSAAKQIHERFDIPVIYLTGLTGDEITERAKITEPFGYILKPFQERELHTIIEIAIHMHNMEKRLRESEGKLNAMLESINDHMIMVDRSMNIVWANKTAKQVFGEDIEGKKCCEIYHGRKEPCHPDPCLSIEALENGKVHEFETEVVNKEGKRFYFSCSANVALRDREGNPVTVLEIARDITDHKRMEDEIRQKLDEVERMNRLMVGRELRMEELKKEIQSLKFKIQELETAGREEGR